MCQCDYIRQLSHGCDVKEAFETGTMLKFVSCYAYRGKNKKRKINKFNVFILVVILKFHSLPSKNEFENFVTVSEHLRTALIK